MAAEDRDTSQASVKTYVPAYQRDEWDDHADELDMSRSEFVRSMVQAGRRGFDPRGHGPETGSHGDAGQRPTDGSTEPADDGTDSAIDGGYDRAVLDLLTDDCLSWDELFEALTDDVERELDEALQRLQSENEITHSGKRGGYVRIE